METPLVAYGVPITSIVGNGFCVPYPIELIIKRKYVGFLSKISYQVLDVNGNALFQVDESGSGWNFREKLIMRDAAGSIILTIREKTVMRPRWTVHRGESSEPDDLLFSLHQTNFLQCKVMLDVFLSGNIHEDIKIAGSFSNLSSKIYMGDSVIAEVKNSFKWKDFFRGRDSIRVKVNSSIDYAFIVALVVVHVEINESSAG